MLAAGGGYKTESPDRSTKSSQLHSRSCCSCGREGDRSSQSTALRSHAENVRILPLFWSFSQDGQSALQASECHEKILQVDRNGCHWQGRSQSSIQGRRQRFRCARYLRYAHRGTFGTCLQRGLSRGRTLAMSRLSLFKLKTKFNQQSSRYSTRRVFDDQKTA